MLLAGEPGIGKPEFDRLFWRERITFRSLSPKGKTFIVTPETREPHVRTIGAFDVRFTNLTNLRRSLEEDNGKRTELSREAALTPRLRRR